jgi:hypothetical protein
MAHDLGDFPPKDNNLGLCKSKPVFTQRPDLALTASAATAGVGLKLRDKRPKPASISIAQPTPKLSSASGAELSPMR